MKAKNYYVYGDEETLKRLKEEYEYIGRDCAVRDGRLVVFALPRRRKRA